MGGLLHDFIRVVVLSVKGLVGPNVEHVVEVDTPNSLALRSRILIGISASLE